MGKVEDSEPKVGDSMSTSMSSTLSGGQLSSTWYHEDMAIRKHVGGLPRHLQTLSRVYRTARSGRTTGAALTKQFSTTNTPFRGQNVLAKYAPGALPVQRALQTDQTFLTSATQPVAMSFQTVPPPSSSAEQDGIIIKDPVPAMIPLSTSSIQSTPKESSQKRGEIIVQGIPIPPKPTPPGEEGTSQKHLSFLHLSTSPRTSVS